MAVYRVIALLADPDALRCVKMQPYPTSDAFATEVAKHFSPFLVLATHKKGGALTPHRARTTPLTKNAQKGDYRRPFMHFSVGRYSFRYHSLPSMTQWDTQASFQLTHEFEE